MTVTLHGKRRSIAATVMPALAIAAAMAVTACDSGGGGGGQDTTEAVAVPAPNANNMRLVGHHDLQGRSSYQPIPYRLGDRWLLFAGHHAGVAMNAMSGVTEKNGFSVLDVTDPAAPVLLHHQPPTGGEASGTQHVQLCSGKVLPNADPDKTYLLRSNGQINHEILDVSDPAAPVFVTTILTTGHTDDGRRNTHKNWWDCESGIGYLLSTVEGWRVPRVLQAYDLGNPAAPRHIRDFALDGMQPGGAGDYSDAVGVHQPVVVGNRIYLGYGSGSNGVLQILDRERFLVGDPGVEDRFAPTAANFLYPQIARLDMPTYWGSHTAKPIYGMEIADYGDDRDNRVRDFLVIVSESRFARCQETRHAMFMVDITEEDKPYPVSNYQLAEEPGDFCNKGGRFGPHSPHDSFNPDFLKKIVLISYFNAGVRAVDIRDPFNPTEVAYFIPETTEMTQPVCIEINGVEECATAIQTNNVNIDDRGYIYLLDRAGTGLHIVELTGSAREIVGLE